VWNTITLSHISNITLLFTFNLFTYYGTCIIDMFTVFWLVTDITYMSTKLLLGIGIIIICSPILICHGMGDLIWAVMGFALIFYPQHISKREQVRDLILIILWLLVWHNRYVYQVPHWDKHNRYCLGQGKQICLLESYHQTDEVGDWIDLVSMTLSYFVPKSLEVMEVMAGVIPLGKKRHQFRILLTHIQQKYQ